MKIYKLLYQDSQTAIADLIAKGVYNQDLSYGVGIHAIVEIGLIVEVEGTYDEQGNELTPPTYINGYHFDVMCEQVIDFGSARVTPEMAQHSFLGFNINQYNKPNTNEKIID
jgi:hypothetical protein